MLLVAGAVLGCTFTSAEQPGDAARRVDAQVSIDGPVVPPARCGSPGVLRGPFTESPQSMGLTVLRPESVVFANGQLIANAVTDGALVGVNGWGRLDLTQAGVDVTVEETGAGQGVRTTFSLRFGAGRLAQMVVSNGRLTASLTDDGQVSTEGIVYAPNQHRAWRIQHADGMLRFETSADRIQWSVLLSRPAPAWIDAVVLSMTVSNPMLVPNPGRAVFSQLNAGATPASWCAADTLRDDFSDGEFANAWAERRDGSSCSHAESGGAAVFFHPAGINASCFTAFTTGALYDLRNSYAEIAVPPITLHRPAWLAFLFADTGPRQFTLYFVENQMCAADSTAVSAQCIPYTNAQHWRLSHDGSMLSWQVSSNRLEWTTLRSVAIGDELRATRISLGARRLGSIDTPITLNITDYNP